MNINRQHVEQLFLEALDLPLERRAAFLESACGGNQALRDDVQSLLDSDVGDEGVAIAEIIEDAARDLEAVSLVGSRIGAYRIIRELGFGGMGAVYLAERADEQFRKLVAMKLIRHGMQAANLLDRFYAERQILAQFDHPNIARLLDGGTAPDGRPYLVMEYVAGKPLVTYCREQNCSIEEKCSLFLLVCDAVAYAHRNLVVHRDLKPGNVLVSSDGVPKLLDFGVAKLLAPDLSHSQRSTTMTANQMMTPDYASPEQVMGKVVTTSTDVYSLGAVLFELLTGKKPHNLTDYSGDEIMRVVCERPIERPSSVVDGAQSHALSGDLDNIVLMAMRKEPERRYATVEQFSEDVRRYLTGRPVIARDDTIRYRAFKFMRRNRLAVLAATLVSLSLVGGIVVAESQARRAEYARQIAEQHRQVAEQERARAEAERRTADQEHTVAGRERDNAVRERDRAEKNARAAEMERAKAEKRLGQLVALANQSLIGIHNRLQNYPGMVPVRRELVVSTLAYLDGVSKEAGEDRELRSAIALAYSRMGDLQGYPLRPNLNDREGAIKSYEKAARLLEANLTAREDPDTRIEWMSMQSRWADIEAAIGRTLDGLARNERNMPFAESIAAKPFPSIRIATRISQVYSSYVTMLAANRDQLAMKVATTALAFAEKAHNQYPTDGNVMHAVSEAHSDLGRAFWLAGEVTSTLQQYRRAMEIRESLSKSRPGDIVLKRSWMLAAAHVGDTLGNPLMFDTANDPAGAVDVYRTVLRIAREIHAADPKEPLGRRDLSAALTRTGIVMAAPTFRQESIRLFEEAIGLLNDLQKGAPADQNYALDLATCHEYLGHRQKAGGELSQAMASYQRSLEIAQAGLVKEPTRPSMRAQLLVDHIGIALLLAETGKRDEAIATAQTAVDTARAWIPKLANGVARALTAFAEVHEIIAANTGVPGWQLARDAYLLAAKEWAAVPETAETRSRRKLASEKAALCERHLAALR